MQSVKFKIMYVRGVIQINPECIYISAADTLTRTHMNIKKNHMPIFYHFCFNWYGPRMSSQLPTMPQRSVVSTTPAKTAIRRVQDFFLQATQKPNKQF